MKNEFFLKFVKSANISTFVLLLYFLFLCIDNPIYVFSICFIGLSFKLFYKKYFWRIQDDYRFSGSWTHTLPAPNQIYS